MHNTRTEARTLARQVRKGLKGLRGVEVILAPPFTALSTVHAAIRGSSLELAGQNVHWQENGAFTGEISPRMLLQAGCSCVIVGHSERRHLFAETDQTVGKKVTASLDAGLRPILCVGESWQERKKGVTTKVIARQLKIGLKGIPNSAIERIEIAYEPVWAIGTGRNATPDQASQVHRWIRKVLQSLFGKRRAYGSRILYGGSVRAGNAGGLAAAPEVDGVLVGGASLKSRDFLSIVRAFVPA